MSKWIRNRKRTYGCPEKLIGKKVELIDRAGGILISDANYFNACWNTSYGFPEDIMSYRIIEDEPAVAEKDPAQIAPNLWAAYKDVLNGEALAALRDVICNQWKTAGSNRFPTQDTENLMSAFNWGKTTQGTVFWGDVYNGQYNKPTTAIELQDAEIGIPEPVNECFGGLYIPDEEEEKHYAKSKYRKQCKGTVIDVYDVLVAFNVTCPAMAHAIKKMLMAGQRGAKDSIQDKEESIASIKRSIELERGE